MKKKIFFFVPLLIMSFLYSDVKDLSDEIKQDFKKYLNEIPGIGLILDEVEYEGLALKNFFFSNGKRFIVCPPETVIEATVDYELHPEMLETLHLHHFIYGLDPSGPQGCLVKSLGYFESEGSAKLEIKAPKDKGVYQVRFCHGEALTYEAAEEVWWNEGNPPEKTVMGIIVVE